LRFFVDPEHHCPLARRPRTARLERRDALGRARRDHVAAVLGLRPGELALVSPETIEHIEFGLKALLLGARPRQNSRALMPHPWAG
jgi:hypothetical protein